MPLVRDLVLNVAHPVAYRTVDGPDARVVAPAHPNAKPRWDGERSQAAARVPLSLVRDAGLSQNLLPRAGLLAGGMWRKGLGDHATEPRRVCGIVL